MPKFSQRSLKKLQTCDPRLQDLFRRVVEKFDCTILTGHRDEATQNEMYATNRSQLRWAQSNHNTIPSRAVDVAPYPIDWKDTERFCLFAGFVLGVAETRNLSITRGGDWDNDTEVKDNAFNDLVHFELRDG